MSAVWMRLRAEARAKWRSWLVLSVLVGVFGGASLAAAAGARRTETAYPRFVEAHRAAHVVIGGVSGGQGERAEQIFREIERLPQVALSCPGTPFLAPRLITSSGRSLSFPNAFVTSTSACERRFNTAKVLSGRLPDLRRFDEALVGFAVAERLGLRVGDRVTIPIGAFERGASGTPIKVHIVGIAAQPGEFPSVSGGSFPSVHLTPAFLERYRSLLDLQPEGPTLRLKRGSADIPAFLAEMRRRRLEADVVFQLPNHVAGVQRSVRFESIALWLLAALTGLATLAVLGQAMARQTFVEATEHPVLRALGMSRGQLFAVGLLRSAAIAAVGAALAVPVAIALSPLTPIGLARIAEPFPGIAVDGLVLVAGAVAAVVLLVAASMPSAWRASSGAAVPESAEPSGTGRPSGIANALSRSGAPPTAVAGVRMALEPGRGRTAVPVRTTLVGTVLAVSALALAMTFSTSLGHLIDTPRVSGYTWDAILVFEGGPRDLTAALPTLRRDASVRQVSSAGGGDVEVGGVRRLTLSFDPGGPIQPAIAEGRPPRAADEIVLGARTLRSIGAEIGDTIEVRSPPSEETGGRPGRFVRVRIVGRAVIPQFFFQVVSPGDGAFMTMEGNARVVGPGDNPNAALLRFEPGVDEDSTLTRLAAKLPNAFPIPGRVPADLTSLSRISDVPIVLAALVAALAVTILGHTLVTSIRKRRRDLAILKTLGFVRRQVRTAVAWQANVVVIVAFVAGIPIGIAIGRWTWRLFANSLAVLPEPALPWLPGMAGIVGVGLVLTNLIASFPARAAARTRPALVLRTE